MTSIPIAVKKETPQVVGPFSVTAAELTAASGGGYAAGVPLFTPATGSLILTSWSVCTETWVVSDAGAGVVTNDSGGFGPSALPTNKTVGQTAVSSDASVGGSSEMRAYPNSTFAASAGSANVWFLVVPTG